MFIGAVILLFLLSVTLVRLFQHFAQKRGWMDVPNARSSHVAATVRGGGVVFVGLWVILIAIAWQQNLIVASTARLLGLWPCLLALVGFWDDRYSISAKWRFLVHFGVAFAAIVELQVLGLIPLWPLWLGSTLGVALVLGFFFIWSINLFNFMDGLDGFAGTEAMVVLGFGGGLLWLSGMPDLAQLAWLLACCIAGFLVWNWPKASIFMGDVGSTVLGFLVVAFATLGQAASPRSLVLWLILYATFWFDATVTLLRRIVGGDAWSLPHKKHAYQRLHQAGWSATAIVLGNIVLNITLGSIGLLVYLHRLSLFMGFALTVVGLIFITLWIERQKPLQYEKNAPSNRIVGVHG